MAGQRMAARFALTVMGLCVAGGAAEARAPITDYEASKLTLDALTATPVYHASHASYRHASYRVARQETSHAAIQTSRMNGWHHVVLRTVAYRPHGSLAAAHPAHVRHRRT